MFGEELAKEVCSELRSLPVDTGALEHRGTPTATSFGVMDSSCGRPGSGSASPAGSQEASSARDCCVTPGSETCNEDVLEELLQRTLPPPPVFRCLDQVGV